MVTADMHYIETVKADAYNGTTWLQIRSKDGSVFTVFMPMNVAQAVADAYTSAMSENLLAAPVAS